MPRVLHVLGGTRTIETYPSVYNGAYLWKKAGWSNILASRREPSEFPGLFSEHLHLDTRVPQRVRTLRRLLSRVELVVTYEPIDQKHVYLAGLTRPTRPAPRLLHHSLEIPTEVMATQSMRFAVHRRLNTKAMQKADCLVIQDELRRSLLLRLFPTISRKPFFLVPNSFIQSIEPRSDSLEWFDKIRSRYKRLVLYVGGIMSWALSPELFAELSRMTETCFLFSGWSHAGFAEGMDAKYRENDNIQFHLGTKTRADLNYMVANSDLGLVFYDPKDENVRCMGLSSGKMHKFLSFNVPIVCNAQPFLTEFLESRGYGLTSSLNGIGASIETVLAQRKTFKNSISEGYATECSFEDSYAPVIARLSHR